VPEHPRQKETPVKNRITRVLATLTLGTLAAVGTIAATDPVTAPKQDTGWGAPDTTHTPIADEAGDVGSVIDDAGAVIDTVLGDSGWG
jgi:hypothetical protein